MDIRKMPPQELANRYLAIQSLVLFYTPEEIEKLNPSFVETIEELTDNSTHGQDFKGVKQINLMYCLFKAPSVELQHIIVVLTRQESDKVKEISDFLDSTSGDFDVNKFSEVVSQLEKDDPRAIRLRELVHKVQQTKERNKIKEEQEKERKRVEDIITKSNQEIDEVLEDLPTIETGTNIDESKVDSLEKNAPEQDLGQEKINEVTRNLKIVH